MRIALIQPPALATISTFAQEAVPPIGLAYLAGALRDAGHEVTVVDAVGSGVGRYSLYAPTPGAILTGLRPDEIIARIPTDVQMIGVSAMFSNAWPPTRDLIVRLREAFPNAFIVLGGEHATSCASYILKSCAAVDACVMGEGELTAVALAAALETGTPPTEVKGVAARESGVAPTGRRSLTRQLFRPRVRDLSTIGRPAWDLFPLEAYLAGQMNHGIVRGRTMPILASRGCPYQCTFCSSSAMWTTLWKAREPEDVLREMLDAVERYQVNDFAFYDLTAIVKREWIERFATLVAKEGKNLTWQLPSGTRTEALDEEICRLLYKSGCRNLNYAPESGSVRVLKRIKKRVDLPRMLTSMRQAVRAGLQVKVNIVLGFPGETWADFADTCRFIAQVAAIGAEAVSVFPFCPYPGSELFEELVESGRIQYDDEYFLKLVYTDIGRINSYNPNISSRALHAQVVAANAVFFGVQAGLHPTRVLRLAWQLASREQESKFANAVEPMRRRREAYRQLMAQAERS